MTIKLKLKKKYVSQNVKGLNADMTAGANQKCYQNNMKNIDQNMIFL